MILTPATGTLLLALALICAGHSPARVANDVKAATVAVLTGWAACLWSEVSYYTPAQIIIDTTGIYPVDPYRIWAVQDAVISAWLATLFLRDRGAVTALVGLLFGAQLIIHAVAQNGGIDDRQPWIDSLFVAQLIAIGAQGAWSSGQRIGDWISRHRRGGMGLRVSRMAHGASSRSGALGDGGTKVICPDGGSGF